MIAPFAHLISPFTSSCNLLDIASFGTIGWLYDEGLYTLVIPVDLGNKRLEARQHDSPR
jgi:hypothetical protein